eukprot:51458-Chlamydomonas_euryale.AAC.1
MRLSPARGRATCMPTPSVRGTLGGLSWLASEVWGPRRSPPSSVWAVMSASYPLEGAKSNTSRWGEAAAWGRAGRGSGMGEGAACPPDSACEHTACSGVREGHCRCQRVAGGACAANTSA